MFQHKSVSMNQSNICEKLISENSIRKNHGFCMLNEFHKNFVNSSNRNSLFPFNYHKMICGVFGKRSRKYRMTIWILFFTTFNGWQYIKAFYLYFKKNLKPFLFFVPYFILWLANKMFYTLFFATQMKEKLKERKRVSVTKE